MDAAGVIRGLDRLWGLERPCVELMALGAELGSDVPALIHGGAGGAEPEQMDDELEFMASSVESGIGADMGTVSLTTLKKNFSRTMHIFSNVLQRPDFREKRLEISRKQS
ncbi:MAG: hypothetical protein WCL50_13725, partial [Spirochaetota bacterium]